MQQESRIHPRVPVGLSAEVRTEGDNVWHTAFLRNLSATGAGILVSSPHPVQSELAIRFHLTCGETESDHEFTLPALVVRDEGSRTGNDEFPVALGIHFLGVEDDAYNWIRRWVWYRFDS